VNLDDAKARLDRHHRRRHRPRFRPSEHELIEIIDDLLEFAGELFTELVHCEDHQQNPRRRIIVQVAINDGQKVQLHAVEVNAEDLPVDQDQATCEWAVDRTDLVTLEPIEGGNGFAIEVVAVGGVFGDATVTATVTEPGGTPGDGNDYVASQIVTVSQDEQIAAIDIVADAPEPK
jgi:hypothetical protein